MEYIKVRLFGKDEEIDYEDLLLSIVGSALSKLKCMKTSENGRDYFIGDGDYEMIIRKLKK